VQWQLALAEHRMREALVHLAGAEQQGASERDLATRELAYQQAVAVYAAAREGAQVR
jgi:hypothetical protein